MIKNTLARALLALNFLLINANQVPAPAETTAFSQGNLLAQKPTGGVIGLGLKQTKSGETIVFKVVPGGPASSAGINRGDQLLSVGGASVTGRMLSEVIKMVTGGPPGSAVELTMKSSTGSTFTKKITRIAPPTGYGISKGKTTNYLNSGFKAPQNNKTAKADNNRETGNLKVPGHFTKSIRWLDYVSPDKSFSLKVPDAWEVKTGQNGKIRVYSYDAESITIWPFFVPKTKITINKARELFSALVKSKASGNKWSPPEQVGENGLRSTYKDGKTKQVVSLVFRPMKYGTVGRLFLASAPQGYSRHYSKIFSNILSSLRFNPQTKSSPVSPNSSVASQNKPKKYFQQPLNWTTFTDPKQGAFSLQVPQRWKVDGAMEQPGSLDYRGWVRTISPAEDIVVFMGDGKIPIFTLPDMQLASYGFVPGSRYNPGGYSSVVAYYIPSKKFVLKYGKECLQKVKMKNIQLVSTHEHPDLARQLNAGFGNLTHFSCSSCKFTAVNSQDTPVIGHFMASTRRTKGLWWVTLVSGVVCSADKEPVGMQVLAHMFGSFRTNPKWKTGQIQSIQTAYAGITQWYNQYNETIRQSFAASDAWRRSFSQQASASLKDTSRSSNRYTARDEWMRQATNSIRDTEDVVDPNTGNTYNIWSGGEYNYLSNDGYSVLSTSQPIYPSAQWTQLTTLP